MARVISGGVLGLCPIPQLQVGGGDGHNREAVPCCHRHDGLWLRGLCSGL